VIGTGQDEWYNAIRGLRALYEYLDPSYFIHPALYYELLALLYGFQRLVLGMSVGPDSGFLDYFLAHEWQFLELARYVSVACGALAVVAAVWLGTLLSGTSGGLLAGLLLASLPLLQTMATAIRVDTLAVAAWIAAAALVVRRHQNPDRRSLLLASAGIGVAAAANYPGALLLGLLGWFEWIRQGDDSLSQRARGLATACAVAFAVFILLNPYVLIDLPNFLRWFFFQAQVSLLTHPHAEEPSPWRYLVVLRDQGLPAVLACLAGVAALVRPWRASGALAAFGLLYFTAFSAMRTQYDRFVLPAVALLCIAGASWVVTQLATRVGPRTATALVMAAAPLILWSAAARFRREMPLVVNPGADYRAEMVGWIAENVPPSASLVFESDTLPLLQTVYDPGDSADRPFQASLRKAFERRHPHLPERIIKAQFIAAVYNYDPELLEHGRVFFLASSQNREFIAANRAALAAPAAFYDALDAHAAVVHETGGFHERLILYASGAACEDTRVEAAPPVAAECGARTAGGPGSHQRGALRAEE
jgi:hypothetical protein